jgi:hypothetical protein
MLEKDTTGINKGWYGILEGNLAKIHYYKKEYVVAIPQLLKAVAITDEAKINNVTASFGLMLANCYIHVNEVNRILPLLPMIKKAVYAQDRDEHFIDLYKLLLVLQDGKPSPERTLQLLDSIDIRKQSLAKQNDRNLLTKNEMETELVAYQERQSNKTAEIRQQLILRNLLWTALGCGVLVSFYVFNKRNKRFQLEQNISKQMQAQTEQELSNARGQLDLFTATLLDKSRQIELLENNIDVSQQNEALEHLRQNTILTEEDWGRFKSLFEKAYPGFFARVNHKFPNLTSGEVRFIAFVKLSFTTREMASTLGVSPVSVRSIRSRLLKKLNFAENENLGQLVSDI